MSAEMPPVTKTDEPADFARALSRGLIALGHDARVALPACRLVEDDARLNVRPVVDDILLAWDDGSTRKAYVQTCLVDEVPFYLVGDGRRFRQATRLDGEDCALFARALLAAIRVIQPHWQPEVVHINDSSPGLAAVYLNALCLREWDLDTAAFLTTVHGEAGSRRGNTLVTGSRLDPDVRVVRKYRSERRLADTYERIYGEALSEDEARPLAA